MATTTTNYGLKKPDMSDMASPAPFNENMDVLDAALKAVSDNKVGKASSHTTGNFMSFDSGGNATDSGKKASDFANASHTHSYLPLSGGTMTGALTLSGAPTANLHATTKKYVDDGLAGKVGKASSHTTGNFMSFDSGGNATDSGKKASDFANASHTHSYLPLSGGTMTGALTLSGAPSANLHAATKKYVDDGLAGKVGKASSHTTGNFMSFDSGGNATDSGKKASDFANASHTHTASEIASGTLTVARGGTGKASVGDTNYTSYNYRGESLNDTTTNPTTNGTIAWKYQ